MQDKGLLPMPLAKDEVIILSDDGIAVLNSAVLAGGMPIKGGKIYAFWPGDPAPPSATPLQNHNA